jgi:hypothetical protein
MSFWSWLSASEKVTSWPAAPAIASTAASAASVVGGSATVEGAGDAGIELFSCDGLGTDREGKHTGGVIATEPRLESDYPL